MKSLNVKTTHANNCPVLGVDASSADYIKQSTAMDLKIKELKEADTDENQVRVREVNRRRADRNGVRPL
jgi:hypothetical protein